MFTEGTYTTRLQKDDRRNARERTAKVLQLFGFGGSSELNGLECHFCRIHKDCQATRQESCSYMQCNSEPSVCDNSAQVFV